MAASSEDRNSVEAPSDWQGWQRWLANVDWSDWRCWLQRVTATDRAAPGHEGGFTWAEAPQADRSISPSMPTRKTSPVTGLTSI